ncbi:hypothetical protein [Capnocytophaga canimorsus]|nr:hypothetical protein [Capnocytophaga canimorsus]
MFQQEKNQKKIIRKRYLASLREAYADVNKPRNSKKTWISC